MGSDREWRRFSYDTLEEEVSGCYVNLVLRFFHVLSWTTVGPPTLRHSTGRFQLLTFDGPVGRDWKTCVFIPRTKGRRKS